MFVWGGAWAVFIMHCFIEWDTEKPPVPKPDLKNSWECGWLLRIVCTPGKIIPRLCHKVHFAVRDNNILQRGKSLALHRTVFGSLCLEIVAACGRDGLMPSVKEFPLQGAEETVELVLHTGLFACDSHYSLCLWVWSISFKIVSVIQSTSMMVSQTLMENIHCVIIAILLL